ncbi:unnamed protein product, partial [Ectocarpus sp. 4 AP-2014]
GTYFRIGIRAEAQTTGCKSNRQERRRFSGVFARRGQTSKFQNPDNEEKEKGGAFQTSRGYSSLSVSGIYERTESGHIGILNMTPATRVCSPMPRVRWKGTLGCPLLCFFF